MNLRRSVFASALGALTLCVALVACGGGDTAAGPTPATSPSETGPSCVPSGTALTIAAKDLAFDSNCLAAPANQPFTIALDNQEAVLHNVAIYPEGQTGTLVFK